MLPFPVSIERYFFTRFSVISNPDHVEDTTGSREARVDFSLEIKQPENGGNVYVAQQRVKMDATGNPSYPYSLDVECLGFFNVDPGMKEDQKSPLVLAVAHNVLYASIREAIVAATSRQPWGPLCIGLSTLQQKKEETAKVKTPQAATKQKKHIPKPTKVVK